MPIEKQPSSFAMRAYFLAEKRFSGNVGGIPVRFAQRNLGEEKRYIFILREREEYAMIIPVTTIYIDNFQTKTQDIVSYFYHCT